MLVLSRRVGEEIVVTLPSGEEVSFLISKIISLNSVVKVGITAPSHIQVDRREVLDRRKEEAKLGTQFVPIRKSSKRNIDKK